jgi:hypothetical protein
MQRCSSSNQQIEHSPATWSLSRDRAREIPQTMLRAPPLRSGADPDFNALRSWTICKDDTWRSIFSLVAARLSVSPWLPAPLRVTEPARLREDRKNLLSVEGIPRGSWSRRLLSWGEAIKQIRVALHPFAAHVSGERLSILRGVISKMRLWSRSASVMRVAGIRINGRVRRTLGQPLIRF